MIGDALIAAIRVARHVARERPELFPAALDAVTDQVDRLLELQGAPAEPLRALGCVMAAMLHEVGQPGADRLVLLTRLMNSAIAAARLERLIPLRGAPPHWLPQVAGAAARNRPFTVIQGGRV